MFFLVGTHPICQTTSNRNARKIFACDCRQPRHILSAWCMESEIVCTISPRYLDKLWQIVLKSFLWNAKPNHNIICFSCRWWCGGRCYYLLGCCLHDDFWCNMRAACSVKNEKSTWGTIYCLTNWYINIYIFIWFRLVSYSLLFIPSIYVVYYYSIKSNIHMHVYSHESQADRWRCHTVGATQTLKMKKRATDKSNVNCEQSKS